MATEIDDVAGQAATERSRPHWGRILAWVGLAALLHCCFLAC